MGNEIRYIVEAGFSRTMPSGGKLTVDYGQALLIARNFSKKAKVVVDDTTVEVKGYDKTWTLNPVFAVEFGEGNWLSFDSRDEWARFLVEFFTNRKVA